MLKKNIKQEAFYKSLHTSFDQAIKFISEKGILPDFTERINTIIKNVNDQEWYNSEGFNRALNKL